MEIPMPREAIAEADITEGAPPPIAPKRKYTRKAPAAPTIGAARRKEVHSTDFQIGQPSPISDDTPREDVSREKSNGHRLFGTRLREEGELIRLDGIEVTPEYLAELAFYEDPVTIIINPSAHKNAANIFENWSNGRGAEMFVNNQWIIVRDLPVGEPITVKRKIVEQIIRARVDAVQTHHEDATVPSPRNQIIKTSSHVHSFSVLRDPSPRGVEWLTMAYARPI
jgi:hypothetical protein